MNSVNEGSVARSGHKKNSDLKSEFERLYRESFSEVYSFVMFQMLDEEAARDVTSDSFLRAARYFERFDPAQAKFATWVKAIARNCAADYYRARKITVPLDNVSDGALPVAEDHSGSLADADLATQLLSCLSEEDREIVRLKFYEGISNNEIAQITGLNASTVSTRVQRALAKMRAKAREEGEA